MVLRAERVTPWRSPLSTAEIQRASSWRSRVWWLRLSMLLWLWLGTLLRLGMLWLRLSMLLRSSLRLRGMPTGTRRVNCGLSFYIGRAWLNSRTPVSRSHKK